jgi:hypothetical protein
LAGPLEGLLGTPANLSEEPIEVRRMVTHRQLAFDDDGHPLGRPEVAPEAVGLGTLGEQSRQLCALFGAQTRPAAGRGSVPQSLDAGLLGLPQTLADRSVGDSKGCGKLALLPALLS